MPTKAECKLLARLPLTHAEKGTLEESWNEGPGSTKNSFIYFLLRLLGPLLIITLAYSYWIHSIGSLMNLVLLAIWVSVAIEVSTTLLVGILCLTSDKKKVPTRAFCSLAGMSVLAKMENWLGWLALIALTALLGHMVTAVYLVAAGLTQGFCLISIREAVLSRIRNIAQES
jgi:hypothetical protein